jgi:hypothetical protein
VIAGYAGVLMWSVAGSVPVAASAADGTSRTGRVRDDFIALRFATLILVRFDQSPSGDAANSFNDDCKAPLQIPTVMAVADRDDRIGPRVTIQLNH